MSSFLFVYGTLRKDVNVALNRLLVNATIFVGKGFMHGQLFEVDRYPGAIESSLADEKVWGEVYQISHFAELIATLDAYEECSEQFAKPHEYVRKRVPVILANGTLLSAWCYIYNWETSCLQRIESGDYLDFILFEK